eukprot:TRINITY_DN23715_c0_g1_i2.p1 TRINITY_DN23715_c0_g1~~TRINITY_DN23715_c0_g1_i2.p1  ORF type:complete len:378 (+),score=24.01 TRINITY_DN23715_c0_g1_i2:122-1135(+)
MLRSLVGSEMCIRDRYQRRVRGPKLLDGRPAGVLISMSRLPRGLPIDLIPAVVDHLPVDPRTLSLVAGVHSWCAVAVRTKRNNLRASLYQQYQISRTEHLGQLLRDEASVEGPGGGELMLKLLTANIPLDLKDPNTGETALMLASEANQTESVTLLLHACANPNLTCKLEATSLFRASRWGHVHVALSLIKHRADLNISNRSGMTPLHVACRYGFGRVGRKLWRARAALNLTDKYGCTPLMLAAAYDKRRLVMGLIRARANLNVQDPSGKTALMLACDNGNKEVTLDLIGAGAQMNLHSNFGCLELAQTMRNDHIAIVKVLSREFSSVGPEMSLDTQ